MQQQSEITVVFMDAAAGAAAVPCAPNHGRPRVQNIRFTKQRSIFAPTDEYDELSADRLSVLAECGSCPM
jgi:hypothetical protein